MRAKEQSQRFITASGMTECSGEAEVVVPHIGKQTVFLLNHGLNALLMYELCEKQAPTFSGYGGRGPIF